MTFNEFLPQKLIIISFYGAMKHHAVTSSQYSKYFSWVALSQKRISNLKLERHKLESAKRRNEPIHPLSAAWYNL